MEALGVMVEVIFCRVVDGVLESRPGLLHLPLRPVYGIGDVECTLFLHRGEVSPALPTGWCSSRPVLRGLSASAERRCSWTVTSRRARPAALEARRGCSRAHGSDHDVGTVLFQELVISGLAGDVVCV